jgi:hypothetical protein
MSSMTLDFDRMSDKDVGMFLLAMIEQAQSRIVQRPTAEPLASVCRVLNRGSAAGRRSTELVLPASFSSDLAAAFAQLPSPQVTVENVLNLAEDAVAQHVSFERDRQGRLTDAVIEPVA